uniref:head GIN domain-containing protein n=1 Tax=Gelidibacter sp. TaxID=2018083 RepID=UPI004048EC2C
MKSLTIVFIFLITLNLSAQNPLEKNVGNFTEVKVYDLIEVNLIKSNENKVVITGDDVDDVEIVNKNGILKVRMKFDKIFNGTKTFVAVHYTKLSIIDGNEGAFISSNELIEQDYIELKAQEGARLKIGLDVNKVDVKAVSGGIVETRGKANNQSININTGGIYEGKAFETQTTNVDIKAGGEADVNASGTVNAKVRAGGDIDIYGKPQTVNENKALGGRIRMMD